MPYGEVAMPIASMFPVSVNIFCFSVTCLIDNSWSRIFPAISNSKFCAKFCILAVKFFSISSVFPSKNKQTDCTISLYTSSFTSLAQGAKQRFIWYSRQGLSPKCLQVRSGNKRRKSFTVSFIAVIFVYGPKYLLPSLITRLVVVKRGYCSFNVIFK